MVVNFVGRHYLCNFMSSYQNNSLRRRFLHIQADKHNVLYAVVLYISH